MLKSTPGPDPTAGGHPATGATSATIIVYNDLRQRIIHGEIAPGEKLKVDALKTMLDTGASPIREALSLLTSDQLVERIDQRGFRTTPVSEAHFNEILMLRCKLDDIALRSSIADGNSGWEEQLVLSHHRLDKAPRSPRPNQDDANSWEELHKQFHLSLLKACGSPILLKFCEQLYDLNIRYRFLAGRAVGYGERNVDVEHDEILNATLARDANLASDRLIQHYQHTGRFLAEQFQNG